MDFAAQHLGARPAVEPLGAVVPISHRVVQGADVDGVVGGIKQGGLLADAFLRPLALGDITDDVDCAGILAVRAKNGSTMTSNQRSPICKSIVSR